MVSLQTVLSQTTSGHLPKFRGDVGIHDTMLWRLHGFPNSLGGFFANNLSQTPSGYLSNCHSGWYTLISWMVTSRHLPFGPRHYVEKGLVSTSKLCMQRWFPGASELTNCVRKKTSPSEPGWKWRWHAHSGPNLIDLPELLGANCGIWLGFMMSRDLKIVFDDGFLPCAMMKGIVL